MKITISYIPPEVREADYILRFVRSALPDAKVRRSAAHPPQICVYLTWKSRLDHIPPDVV